VHVADGRATLSGIVHNYRERWAAAEAAVMAGAISVENELRIE
jgi:osmotically-inducible protein OsmY